ncbi:MAG TPA: quinohemoprotein amine dehydrogenase subunit alpha [Rhodocyclaceae bacterium]|nr:quinohemoprotein amine dehydrogenase subunit alpha [Rhodocyclaceae bacterium]
MALIKKNSIRAMLGAGALALSGALSTSVLAAELDGRSIIRANCLTCHTEDGASGKFSRISEQRKTPEGWQMTLNRMEHLRSLKLPAAEKRAVIKYLADTQGLAPSEAAPYRYLLEQDTNRVEEVGEAYAEMCARCHSGARFGLQRRSEAEWNLLVHFHMGQHPTLELHAMSRDRPWMQLALNETVPQLAKDYPFDSQAWRDWQQAAKPQLGGSWRLLGYVPGKGEFDARMIAAPAGADRFELRIDGRYADGSPMSGSGTATVYTGYEWRGNLNIDGVAMRQVLAADPKGGAMSGRLFVRSSREIGGELRAVKEGSASQVLAVMPAHLRAGEAQTLTIVGSRLNGSVSLGKGVRVLDVLSRSADRITVRAQANGAAGMRDVSVGRATGAGLLAVYDRVARVDVSPANAVSRFGGPGDVQMEKVRVAYRAVGYAAGPDGEAGTDDDLRLGYMPATWAIAPFDEAAAEEKDHEFAGSIDADGVFTPGDAGPNPQRRKSANNGGNLSVVATVGAGAEAVTGHGHLLVAVPDFVRRVLD